MKKLFRRYDLIFTVLLFILAVPAEYYEIFSLLEDQTISFRHIFRMHYGNKDDTTFSKEIVLVNTDEAFFQEYGSYPLRRTDIGKIAENLHTLGAKVVALDILMDFPSSYGEDPIIAKSLATIGRPLLVSQAEFKGNQFIKLNPPTPVLNAVVETGYSNISSSSAVVTTLSKLRIYPEVAEKGGWPFAIKALALYWNLEPTFEGQHLTLGKMMTIPLDQFNNLYIDFPSLPSGIHYLSEVAGLSAMEFLDISDLDDNELNELSYWVKDKIVLLGDTSEVSHDWFDTPVGMVYGVEIIADTIHTILKGCPLRPAPLSMEVLLSGTFMLTIIFTGRISHPSLRALIATLFILTYITALTWAYVQIGLVISMVYTLLAGVISFLAISLRYYLMVMGQKHLIQNAFGQYLSPKVVDILVKDPSKLTLGGEQREMTALFSDVAGFSSISENLTPKELVHLLNEYLTAMCNIIARHHGTIDKFEGDAIIAFWGAPIDQADHAKLACLACIDMQKEMHHMRNRLKEANRPAMHIRIGLNSGPMVVGNMGSAQRMDYTIMGDAVNLAARLEGANKFYGSDTLISETTYKLAQEVIDVRQLDTVRVVGKREAVTIYQLLDRKNQVSGTMAEMLVYYEKGLTAYQNMDFSQALLFFQTALKILPTDGPCQTYVDRCQQFLLTPPDHHWDGVFQLTSKG
ncbi:MAG: CHASE2 domain-containing protein [Magnetococcus sp. DMHC-6]